MSINRVHKKGNYSQRDRVLSSANQQEQKMNFVVIGKLKASSDYIVFCGMNSARKWSTTGSTKDSARRSNLAWKGAERQAREVFDSAGEYSDVAELEISTAL